MNVFSDYRSGWLCGGSGHIYTQPSVTDNTSAATLMAMFHANLHLPGP